MGQAKRMMIEEQERGYSSAGGKWVCANCFVDEGLKRFVREHACHAECSYCDATSSEALAAPIDDVIGFLVERIEREYDIPENELPYDSGEGGWQGDTVDTWDLLREMELVEDECPLLDDMTTAISNQRVVWCRKDYFSMREHEIAMAAWESFKALVMHRCRFVFFRMREEPKDPHDHWGESIDPLGILDRIGALIRGHSLVRVLPAGTKVFRVRLDPEKHFDSIRELGPPPCSTALCANRMSPAGVAMFYAAADAETAIHETWDRTRGYISSTGVFATIKECRIVDLTNLPSVPSLTEEGREGDREDLRFLHQFVWDAAQPVEKSDKAHVDYAPTQVVAEYIRHVFKDDVGNMVQGIAYRSSRNGKTTFVFFWEHPEDRYASLGSIDRWCKLDRVDHSVLAPVAVPLGPPLPPLPPPPSR